MAIAKKKNSYFYTGLSQALHGPDEIKGPLLLYQPPHKKNKLFISRRVRRLEEIQVDASVKNPKLILRETHAYGLFFDELGNADEGRCTSPQVLTASKIKSTLRVAGKIIVVNCYIVAMQGND